MIGMENILTVLLGIAMVLTLIIMFVGVISFAFNTKLNQTSSTKLMAARVAMQGIALFIFLLVALSAI